MSPSPLRSGAIFGAASIALVSLALLYAGAGGADLIAVPSPNPSAIAPSVSTRVSPSASPIASASPSAVPRREIVIQSVGDVSLDPAYLPVFRDKGYGWAWSGLDGVFMDDDLSIVNLECPATTISDPIVKTFNFRCDPLALRRMRDAGIEVANQANNHAFDQGPRGLIDSLVQIRAAGIATVGAGEDQREAMRPALFELGGFRVAVVGIGQVLDPVWQVATRDSPGTAAGHDFGIAIAQIEAAARVADVVIVVIHWGVELDTEPRAYQVEQARLMVEAGADIIFGHHAHRLQRLDYVAGRPVFYGLGNFVWPRFSLAGATTAIARVVVRPDGTFHARFVPVGIVSNGHPVPV